MDTLSKRRHTKEEKEILRQVFDDYSTAKTSRQSNCYWDTSTSGEGGDVSGSGGGDWLKRVDLQDKMYTMWFDKPSRDQYESNVKSPMTSGRVESSMQKLRRVALELVVRPEDSNNPKDKRKARILQALLNSLIRRKNFKSTFATWWKDALVHPMAFLQIYYLRKHRDVKMIPGSLDDLNEKQKKELAKQKKKGQVERVFKEESIVDYDDIAVECVEFNEIYPDPSARYIHGESYEAQYIFRRMLPSFQQFQAMFKGDPDAKNVDKVKPGSAYGDDDQEFFRPPQDVENDDYVQLLHYFNKADDRYVVVANDVIIKDMPLPYNHKQLPFVAISTFENPHQFYHISLADKLLPLQTEEETLKNLTYDRLHITANPMLKVKRGIYGEFSRAYQIAEPGKMLPVNNMEDVDSLEYPAMSFDMFRALELLSRDAAMATQVDPTQMGVNQKYIAATTSMLNKEQMDAFINGLIEGWSEAFSIMGYQILSLMKQFYTKEKIKDSTSGEVRYRRIRLEGVDINPETIEVTEKNQGEYSFFEIKPEYFEIAGDWDVTVAPESSEVVSKAIEMQKSQANLAQLAPFMVDPANNQARAANPQGWINGPGALEWYLETNNIPEQLLITLQEDEDISIERATKQGQEMLKGETIAGIPGESDIHKRVHVKQLEAQNDKVRKLEEEVAKLGPMMGTYIEVLPIGEEVDKEKDLARRLGQHLSEDDMPRFLREEGEVNKALPPKIPMPPGLTEAGGGTPPVPAGGNQGAGMGESQMGGPGGNTGRPPMAGPI